MYNENLEYEVEEVDEKSGEEEKTNQMLRRRRRRRRRRKQVLLNLQVTALGTTHAFIIVTYKGLHNLYLYFIGVFLSRETASVRRCRAKSRIKSVGNNGFLYYT